MAIPVIYVLPSNGVPAESSFALESVNSDCVSFQSENLEDSTHHGFVHDTHDLPKENESQKTVTDYKRTTFNGQASELLLRRFELRRSSSRRLTHRPAINELEYAYLRSRLMQSERYMKYRSTGAVEKGKKTDRDKWPDHYEDLFWKAIIKWGPIKKGQTRHLGDRGGLPLPISKKPKTRFGRNELISIFIGDWYGLKIMELHDFTKCRPVAEAGPRKWVGSHVQVMRAFFKGDEMTQADPYVMGFLGGFDEWPRIPIPGFSLDLSHKQDIMQRACIDSVVHRPSRGYVQQILLPQPPNLLLSQGHMDYPILKLEDFKMCIQHHKCQTHDSERECPRDAHTCTFNTLHDITKSQKSSGFATAPLDAYPGWKTKFPHLETMLQGDESDCNILYAESTIALTTESLPEDSKLSITNSFLTEPGIRRMGFWQCRTRIFESGRLKDTVDDREAKNSEDNQITYDRVNPCLLHVSFGSTYWVHKVNRLVGRLRSAMKEATTDKSTEARTFLRKVEGEVSSDIRNTTVAKEMFIVDGATGKRTRVMIIYWQFKRTRHPDEVGVTTWRTLVPPKARKQSSKTSRWVDVEENVMEADIDFNTPLPMVNQAGARIHPSLSVPSQNHLDIVPSVSVYEPPLYNFTGIDIQNGTLLQEEHTDVSDYTMAGAEVHHTTDYEESMTFDISMTGMIGSDMRSATLENPLYAYDPSVLDGSADASTQLLPHINRPHHNDEHGYILVDSMEGYEPDASETEPETYSQESDVAHQYHYSQTSSGEVYIHNHHYAINGLFEDAVEGSWVLEQQQQQQQQHGQQEHQQQVQRQQELQLQRQLQLQQQLQNQKQLEIQQGFHLHQPLTEAQNAHQRIQDEVKREGESWEIIEFLDEFDTIGKGSTVAATEAVSVRALLPSVLEE